jgi:hypothetical protein
MGVSAREAAKLLGLTHQALCKAAKTGRVTREKDGTYSVEKVRRQLAQNTDARKRRIPKNDELPLATDGVFVPATEEDDPETSNRTFTEAQRRREWLRVKRDELDLARKRAELAPIGEVNAWVAGMVIRAREILLRIGPELRDRLAQTSNPNDCQELIDREIRRALNELSEFKAKEQ